jgi:hypothetical protein
MLLSPRCEISEIIYGRAILGRLVIVKDKILKLHTQLFFAVEPEIAPHDYKLAQEGYPEQRQSHWTP